MTQKALKELLEAVEAAIQAGDWKVDGACDPDSVIRRSKEALAQPEQEPVAWLHNFIDGGISIGKRPADLERHPDRWTALYKDPKPCPTCEALARTVMLDQTSHDTTPPQRTWVGLTEQDLDYLCNLAYTGDEEFALAVQAKLMEKNA